MRKAASGWEDDYARVVVHGDDFTFAGTVSKLRKSQAKMHEW